jgi:hypothetical protein
MTSSSSLRWPLLIGTGVWLAAVLVLHPSPFETDWARLLLLLAPLVLVPLGLSLLPEPAGIGERRLHQIIVGVQLPATLLLGWSLLLAQGWPAGLLALPWLVTTGLLALRGLLRWRHSGWQPAELALGAALVFIAVGGGWAMLDRLGLRPLDFDAVIVLLTAIHFHYAGFALPLLTGLAVRRTPGLIATAATAGVIVGVPLVAAGITATKLGLDPLLECVAAWALALTGLLVALMHLRLVWQGGAPALVRVCWATAALALAVSMILAALYGSRFFLSVAWLDIPWMRALHGSANALGFALVGMAGWKQALALEAGNKVGIT